MKTALMILLLSGVVLGQLKIGDAVIGKGAAFVVDTTNTHKYLTSSRLYIGNPMQFSNTINIHGVSLFIKDGRLEITYDKDIKPSESVKQFFEWVKEYVKGEYYIIKRKDLDKLMEKK